MLVVNLILIRCRKQDYKLRKIGGSLAFQAIDYRQIPCFFPDKIKPGGFLAA